MISMILDHNIPGGSIWVSLKNGDLVSTTEASTDTNTTTAETIFVDKLPKENVDGSLDMISREERSQSRRRRNRRNVPGFV